MILFLMNLAAALVLFLHSLCAINHMTRRTNHVQRVAYIVLAAGALAVLVGPLYGYRTPVWSEAVVNVGAASVLISRVWLDWKARS